VVAEVVVEGREVRVAARVVDKVVVAGRKAAVVVRAAGAVVVGVVEVADRVEVAIANLPSRAHSNNSALLSLRERGVVVSRVT
jgi:orotate phosphoribosyltransferase